MTNPFERFASLGYTRLVPIIPPNAPISEKSNLFKRVGTNQDGRGKTPGIKWRDGTWSGFDWIPYEADSTDFRRWHGMGAGVGIKTGDGLVAIDADTTDVDHARIIRDTMEEFFGKTPIRVGQYPKALYPLRVATAFNYARVEFGPERQEGGGRIYRVEILSDRKQFVAYGIHPKTMKPYEWVRDLVPLDELPMATPQQLTAFLQALKERLPDTGDVVREGAASTVSQASLIGKPDLVRKAVEAIPNTSEHFPSRESYRDFGYAIKASLPDDEAEAFGLFSDWCARWQDGENDPDVVTADWRRMKPPYRRGAHWLYELAEAFAPERFSAADVWLEDLDNPKNPFAATLSEIQAASDADVFDVLDIEAIRNRPPIEWLVARHIPKHSTGFLYSAPGAGKTFWMLDVAMHIADGRKKWNGDAINAPDGANVLYLAAEGAYGFKNRVEAWIQRKGASDGLAKRFRMIEATINFMKPEDIQKLLRTVKAVIGDNVALVIVDTVSRAMPGADENLQKDMTLFVAACDAVQRATGGAVVGVHHAGKSGDMRGSTVLLGAGDFVFGLERRKGATVGTLTCEKQKDGPDGWSEPYRFETVELGAGQTSLVVERADIGIGPDDALTPATTASVFDAMRAAWDAGEPWTMAPQAKDRYAIRCMVAGFGFTAERADEAIRTWEASGLIRIETASAKHRRSGFKVLVGPGQDVLVDGIFA